MRLPQITVVCLRPQLRHDHSDLIGQQSPINDANLENENQRSKSSNLRLRVLETLTHVTQSWLKRKGLEIPTNPKRHELQWVFPYRLSHTNLIDVGSLGRRLQMTSARLVIIHLGEAIRKNGTRSCDLSCCKDVENPAFVDHVPREITGFPHLMLIYPRVSYISRNRMKSDLSSETLRLSICKVRRTSMQS